MRKLGGLQVYTTIDLKKQDEARARDRGRSSADVGPSSAIVTIDPKNGHILAMASSADYGKSKFNLAAQGHRQPGSTFKAMALLTALREGVEPRHDALRLEAADRLQRPAVRPDRRQDLRRHTGAGDLTLHERDADVRQLRLRAARAPTSGPTRSRRPRAMMGITSKLNGYPAEALGGLERGVSPLEMANAYATIATGGYRNRPTRDHARSSFPDGHVRAADPLEASSARRRSTTA